MITRSVSSPGTQYQFTMNIQIHMGLQHAFINSTLTFMSIK